MAGYSELSQFKGEKPKDWLPDGLDEKDYLKEDKEWPGLEKRLGNPRILKHIYWPEVLAWIQKEFKDNPDDFSYFEAGCGHGNDLRAIRKELEERGHFLGVDMSTAEIMRGMEFRREQEDTKESKKLFAQGDLRDLKHINIWDEVKENFSKPAEIKDGEFDVVYTEAVLHGLGYGKNTYKEKKESAQQFLNELYRVCKVEGKLFGRANVFDQIITKEQQFELMRRINDWRFIPEAKELEEMLKQAGFKNIKITLEIREDKEKDDLRRKNNLRFSFLGEK